MAEPVAAALHRNDFGVMEEPVQNRSGSGHVIQEFAPFLNWPVGSHESGFIFITTHHDFKKHFAGFGRQDLESHVINDQEIRLEITAQGSVQLRGRLVGLELLDQVKDGAVKNLEARFDDMIADGLSQMTFPQARWSDQEDIPALPDELAGSQVIHLLPLDGGIKGPVEILQRLVIAEACGFGALIDDTLLADIEFILEEQFQKLFMRQLMRLGFVQAQFQAGQKS